MVDQIEEKKRLMDLARQSFLFLEDSGYKLLKSWGPTGASFKDGFQLVYGSSSMQITVEFLDAEFVVWFQNGAVKTDFVFLDKNLNSGASGYRGTMFPQEALAPVIRNIAGIISNTFSSVINNDRAVWSQIEKLVNAPIAKRRLP